LEIAFATKKLRQLCENEEVARSSVGHAVAGRLKARLADLSAASCVKELVAGRPRQLTGRRPGCLAVKLTSGWRLVICANHNAVPEVDGGAIDWSRVNRVKVVDIENDHA
jgi:proteic killer suppression protein